jgi:hypothetical protein
LDVFAWKTKLKKRNGFLLLYWQSCMGIR